MPARGPTAPQRQPPLEVHGNLERNVHPEEQMTVQPKDQATDKDEGSLQKTEVELSPRLYQSSVQSLPRESIEGLPRYVGLIPARRSARYPFNRSDDDPVLFNECAGSEGRTADGRYAGEVVTDQEWPRAFHRGFVPIEVHSAKYVANLPARWNVNRGATAKGMVMHVPHVFPPPLTGRAKRSAKGDLPGQNPQHCRLREDLQLQTELRDEDADEVAALLHSNFHPGVQDLISACVEAGRLSRPWKPGQRGAGGGSPPEAGHGTPVEAAPAEDVRVWQLRGASSSSSSGALCSAVAWRPLKLRTCLMGTLVAQRGIEVLFLATAPSQRGGGCAEDLVARLEDFARLAGWDFLCVAVVPAAPGFWGKCGLRLCASAEAVRGDRPPCAEASWLQLGDTDLARHIASFCASPAPLREELVSAMVSFSDTPLYVKDGLRGPQRHGRARARR